MARHRRNPLLAVLNPRGVATVPIGAGVREIVYDRHATRGKGPWVHTFQRGDVEVRGLKDGRAIVTSKAGARVWEKDGRAGWLINPASQKRLAAESELRSAGYHDGQYNAYAYGLARYQPWVNLIGSDRLARRIYDAAFTSGQQFPRRNAPSNPGKGHSVARRRKHPKKARRSGGKRKPPRGFKSWKSYMASIRPHTATTKRGTMKSKRRKSRGGRRHTNPAAQHHLRGRRHGRHRGRRRNPPMLRGIMAQLADGAKGGALVVAGKIVARAVPALIGVQPIGMLGIGVQTGVGAIGAVILGRFMSRELSRPFLYGVFANAFESLIRGWNIPVLTPALGDETELNALAGVQGYVEGYLPPGMAGDESMPSLTMGASA